MAIMLANEKAGVLMELFLQHCQAALQGHSGLIATLFLGGLVGSLTHCVGMCSPFVFAQTASSLADNRQGAFGRLRGAALLPYHLGRVTTYAALGVIAAGFSGFFAASTMMPTVSATLMIFAGILFFANAAPSARISMLPLGAQRAVRQFGGKLGEVARPFFAGRSAYHRYALGVTLGFLPCGLVAAALLAAAATGDPVAGGIGLASFGLATIPALTFTAAIGQFSANRWPNGIKTVARGAMVLSGASLFAIAGGLLS